MVPKQRPLCMQPINRRKKSKRTTNPTRPHRFQTRVCEHIHHTHLYPACANVYSQQPAGDALRTFQTPLPIGLGRRSAARGCGRDGREGIIPHQRYFSANNNRHVFRCDHTSTKRGRANNPASTQLRSRFTRQGAHIQNKKKRRRDLPSRS